MTVSRNPPPPESRPALRSPDPRLPFPTGPPPTCTEQLLSCRSVEVPCRTRWLESTGCRLPAAVRSGGGFRPPAPRPARRATPSAESGRLPLHNRTERPAARRNAPSHDRTARGTRRGRCAGVRRRPSSHWRGRWGWPVSPSASTTSCSASRRCPARRRPAPRRGGPGTVAVGARPAAPVPGSAGGPRTPPAAALLLAGGRRRAVRRSGPRLTHFADAKTGARSVDRAPVGSRLGVGQGSGVVPGIRAAPPTRTAASTDRCSAATPPGGTRTGPPSRS